MNPTWGPHSHRATEQNSFKNGFWMLPLGNTGLPPSPKPFFPCQNCTRSDYFPVFACFWSKKPREITPPSAVSSWENDRRESRSPSSCNGGFLNPKRLFFMFYKPFPTAAAGNPNLNLWKHTCVVWPWDVPRHVQSSFLWWKEYFLASPESVASYVPSLAYSLLTQEIAPKKPHCLKSSLGARC